MRSEFFHHVYLLTPAAPPPFAATFKYKVVGNGKVLIQQLPWNTEDQDIDNWTHFQTVSIDNCRSDSALKAYALDHALSEAKLNLQGVLKDHIMSLRTDPTAHVLVPDNDSTRKNHVPGSDWSSIRQAVRDRRPLAMLALDLQEYVEPTHAHAHYLEDEEIKLIQVLWPDMAQTCWDRVRAEVILECADRRAMLRRTSSLVHLCLVAVQKDPLITDEQLNCPSASNRDILTGELFEKKMHMLKFG